MGYGLCALFNAKAVQTFLGLNKEDVSRLADVSTKSVRFDHAMPETVRAVEQFRQRIEEDFPAKKLIVFGGRARGDHRPDSDADVAVLLEGKPLRFFDTKLQMANAVCDVLLDTGISISPLPVWIGEWEHPGTYVNPALLANIAREGIRL